MPLYELLVIMRSMKESQTIAKMKHVGELLLNNKLLLRSIENIGLQRELPFKVSTHGKINHTGSYIMYRYHAPPTIYPTLQKEFKLDLDIIKTVCVQVKEPEEVKCTLEDELQIPMKRPSVQNLLKTGARTSKPKYKGTIEGPF